MDGSVRMFWQSLWQGPKVGGILFGLLLLGVLLVVRVWRNRRGNAAHVERCRRTAKKHSGLRMKRNPDGHDKPFHVDANTMPLGVKKLVKTGSPYDKGVMA